MARHFLFSFALSCTALAAAVGTSRGEDDKPFSPLPGYMPLHTDVCYGVSFDADWLASHPSRRVTSFHIFRDFSPDPTSEEDPGLIKETRESDGLNGDIPLTAYVRFRDRNGAYWNWLSCRARSDGGVRCGLPCDGGGFKIKPNGAGLDLENDGFVVIGGCGASEDEAERQELVSPETDRLFGLVRKSVEDCATIRDSLKPAWEKRGPPIRTRLVGKKAVCFERSYDAAHLAGHPNQKVRRIAVSKAPGLQKNYASLGYVLTFRVELIDGRRFVRRTTCSPDRYAYACTHDPAADAERDFYLTRDGIDRIILRDRHGWLGKLFGVTLGDDDRLFRLSQVAPSVCGK